jgi:hypothetical protein
VRGTAGGGTACGGIGAAGAGAARPLPAGARGAGRPPARRRRRGYATDATGRRPAPRPALPWCRRRHSSQPCPGRSARCPGGRQARPRTTPMTAPPGCRPAAGSRHRPAGSRSCALCAARIRPRPAHGVMPPRPGRAWRGSAGSASSGSPRPLTSRSGGHRHGRPGPARPPAAPRSARCCAVRSGRSGRAPARRRSTGHSGHYNRRTGGHPGRSWSPGRRSRYQTAAADNGCAPGPTVGRRPGIAPEGDTCWPGCAPTGRTGRPGLPSRSPGAGTGHRRSQDRTASMITKP